MIYRITEQEGTRNYVLVAPDGTVVSVADRPRRLSDYAFEKFGEEIEVRHDYDHERGEAANWRR